MTAPSKPIVQITTVGSQRDRRYLDTVYDQHKFARFPNGRPWWGYRELAANRESDPHLRDGFCGGELTPGRHIEEGESRESAWRDCWSAPWYPEFRFFQLDYKRNRVTIRYDLQMGYDAAEEAKYYRAAALICVEKNWAETPYGVRPRWEVRAVLGEPPRSPLLARAAQAGDEWILGITTRQNPHLATLLGLTPSGLPIPDQFPSLAKADDVLTMTRADLKELIVSELARMTKRPEPPKRKPTGASAEHMARMRAVKDAKEAAKEAAKVAALAETAVHEIPESADV